MNDNERLTKLECNMRRAAADVGYLYRDPLIGGGFIRRCLAIVGYQIVGWLIIMALLGSIFACSLLFRLSAVM